MSAQHTQGKLEVAGSRVYFSSDGGFDLRGCPLPDANARRLAACWNACEGLSTEALERSDVLSAMNQRHLMVSIQRDDLLEALELKQRRHDELLATVQELIEARKAEGRAKFGHVWRPPTREHEQRESAAWRQLHRAVEKAQGDKS
jgi:hypothetical protein